MSRIDPGVMLRLREAVLQILPTSGEPMLPKELHVLVGKRLAGSNITTEIGMSQVTSAIKWLRDRKQIRSIRYAGNTARYLKKNIRDTAKPSDLILPDRQMHPMEFVVYLLAQPQFSGSGVLKLFNEGNYDDLR